MTIPAEELPAGGLPAGQPEQLLAEEEIPAGALPEQEQALAELAEEEVPGGALPNTGGLDASLFYLLGGLLTASGLWLKKREKTND